MSCRLVVNPPGGNILGYDRPQRMVEMEKLSNDNQIEAFEEGLVSLLEACLFRIHHLLLCGKVSIVFFVLIILAMSGHFTHNLKRKFLFEFLPMAKTG